MIVKGNGRAKDGSRDEKRFSLSGSALILNQKNAQLLYSVSLPTKKNSSVLAFQEELVELVANSFEQFQNNEDDCFLSHKNNRTVTVMGVAFSSPLRFGSYGLGPSLIQSFGKAYGGSIMKN